MKWPPGAAALRAAAQHTHLQPSSRRGRLTDTVAGVTVAAYLVPQVMAYAQIAGLPAVTGLWAVIGPLAVYAVLGSSRQLSVGPESTTAMMTAVALMPLAAGDPTRYAALAALLTLLVGAICLIAWGCRLGFVADLLSKPVLTGYMAGVALIMVAGQLHTVTGVPVHDDGPAGQVMDVITHLGESSWPTTSMAATALLALFALRRWAPRVPGPLIVVIVAAATVAVFGLGDRGIELIGTVPTGLPMPGLPPMTGDDVAALAVPALGVALVGYTDNVLTARAFAFKNRHPPIDAHREWLALGAANISSSLLRGFPVSSSGSRTAIAATAGARTQLYSLVALTAVVLTLISAGPLLSTFPRAALGALVVFAATQLIDIAELRRIARFRRSELLIALLTTATVVALGVMTGIVVAVGLSVADLLRRVARPHDGILGVIPGLAGMHDIDDYPGGRRIPGLVVYRYDAPLCFANADDFRHRALAAAHHPGGGQEEPATHWFVLNAEANVDIDLTAADALKDVVDHLQRDGVVVALARAKHELLPDLHTAGIIDQIGSEHVYPTLPTAVQAFDQWRRRQNHQPPPTRP